MFVFIDTAVTGCNIGIADQGNILAMHQEPISRGHAEHIIPIYEKYLEDAGVKPSDIAEVIVTVGPGSFTGLRVGLTVAQFIGFTLNVPVRGVTSFQAFSAHITDDVERVVLIETKRSDYYVRVLDASHQALTEPLSVDGDAVCQIVAQYPNAVVTGDAVSRFVTENKVGNRHVQQDMIELPSMLAMLVNGRVEYTKAEAFYIREADVSQPKPIKRA